MSPFPLKKRDETYFDIDCNKELEFSFEIGLAPEFELNADIKDPIEKYEIEIDEKQVDERIEELKDRYADLIYPDDMNQGDIVFGKLFEVNEDGEEVEGGFEKMVALNPKRLEVEEVYAPMVGKKVEDVLPFSLSTVADNDEDLKTMLVFTDEDLEASRGKNLHFQIKRISRLVLAELNEELFKKAFGEDTDVTDEEGLRAKLREELSQGNSGQAVHRFRGEIKKAIEANHELAYPEAFLKKWMLESHEQVNEDNVDGEYEGLIESLKWSLIVEKIKKEYPETDIKPEEIESEVRAHLRGRMGSQMQPEMEDQYVKYIMQNEEIAQAALLHDHG